MKLSEHFSYDEFTRSQVATRKGIDNRPDTEELNNLYRLAEFMEDARSLLGNSPHIPSSVFRSKLLNKAIGGAVNSHHLYGLAIDYTVIGYTVQEVFQIMKNSDLEYDQLILEYDQWIHLSIPAFNKKARRQNLIATLDENGRTRYTEV